MRPREPGQRQGQRPGDHQRPADHVLGAHALRQARAIGIADGGAGHRGEQQRVGQAAGSRPLPERSSGEGDHQRAAQAAHTARSRRKAAAGAAARRPAAVASGSTPMITLACTASTWRMATDVNSGKPNTTPADVSASGHRSRAARQRRARGQQEQRRQQRGDGGAAERDEHARHLRRVGRADGQPRHRQASARRSRRPQSPARGRGARGLSCGRPRHGRCAAMAPACRTRCDGGVGGAHGGWLAAASRPM